MPDQSWLPLSNLEDDRDTCKHEARQGGAFENIILFIHLESPVLSPSCAVLGIMTGFFLFCVYNCCRFSDAQNAEHISLGETDGLVVVHSGTRQHKTATTADKRTTLLPLVCLGSGLESASWATAWILLISDQDWNERRGYLLPADSELTGKWAGRRMTSGEGTLWLRECLAAKDIEWLEDVKPPTTHSCKATLLSWLSKAGNFTMAERQVMGHHLGRPSTSALTYGRQNFIPILVKVAVLLKRIVNDNFNPDAQPSRIVRQALLAMEEESNGYWSQMGMPVGVSESEDSPTTDVEDHEDLEISVGHLVVPDERRLVQLSQPENFEQHRLSGVVHLIMDDSRFACGRNRTANYLPAEQDFTLGVHICDQCKASAAFSREPVP